MNQELARQQLLVMRHAEGFFDSVVLFALNDLGVFRLLADGPMPADAIHTATGGDRDLLEAILQAGVVLGMLDHTSEGYVAGAPFLACLSRPEAPESLAGWVSFLHSCVAPLTRVQDGVREFSRPLELLQQDGEDKSPAIRMTAAMNAYAHARAQELPRRIDFSDTRRLLDVGCGPGTYAFAILEVQPKARATLVDREAPLSAARQFAADRSLSDRIEFIATDILSWESREKFDTILVSNVLHMLGSVTAKRLLSRLANAINPGGRIIIQAQFLDDDRLSPRWPVLLNLLQRAGTPSGHNHTIAETGEWLTDAGFVNLEHVSLSVWNVCSCLVGFRSDC